MKTIKRIADIALLIMALVFFMARASFAHPMGNFAICHDSEFTAEGGSMRLRYVLDFAEIPTVTEMSALDSNHDKTVSDAEKVAYLNAKTQEWKANLTLLADNKPADFRLIAYNLFLRPGAGGLQTLRVVTDWRITLPNDSANHVIHYKDGNYLERTGWKEISAAGSGTGIVYPNSMAGEDRSRELTAYPLNVIPPQETEANFSVAANDPSGLNAKDSTNKEARDAWLHDRTNPRELDAGTMTPSALAPPAAAVNASAPNTHTPQDRFTQTIATAKLTPAIILIGLGVAFIFGAFHALSPGHGKTMVAAYLVGSHGTPKHAVLLGLTVTITHTFGVFLLGFITLFASQYIVPERLYSILSIVSGLSVFGVGVWLLATHSAGHSHDHSHTHDHDHEHSHDHSHDEAPQGHFHTHEDGTSHFHTHDAEEMASEAAHSHSHDEMEPHTHDHDHDHSHSPGGSHTHSPGGKAHSHALPTGPITLKSLIALGISGGIVPCPSALVVLLSAIALHRLAFGMLLIVAFSAGLASVLIAIGIAVVSTRKWIDRIPQSGRVMRAAPIFSAGAITLIGAMLVIRALAQGTP